MLIPLTRAMAQGPMSPEREARLKEMERLTMIALVALKRVWKLLPDPEHQVPLMPPDPTKPSELRRLAARMRARIVPEESVGATVEDVEKTAVYQKRAIWCWKKMRAIEKRLKPLWAAEEAECERLEQSAFHETKDIVTGDPGSSMKESFREMKRAFRECTGRKGAGRGKLVI
jgi:hypothetical protein